MLPVRQKTQNSSDQAPRVWLPTGPRARAPMCPRAGPWITLKDLTGRCQSEKVIHVLPHAHRTDMV